MRGLNLMPRSSKTEKKNIVAFSCGLDYTHVDTITWYDHLAHVAGTLTIQTLIGHHPNMTYDILAYDYMIIWYKAI